MNLQVREQNDFVRKLLGEVRIRCHDLAALLFRESNQDHVVESMNICRREFKRTSEEREMRVENRTGSQDHLELCVPVWGLDNPFAFRPSDGVGTLREITIGSDQFMDLVRVIIHEC